MKDGYEAAAGIDGLINDLLGADPIDKTNWREWYKFTRTVDTSLHLIFSQIETYRRVAYGSEAERLRELIQQYTDGMINSAELHTYAKEVNFQTQN